MVKKYDFGLGKWDKDDFIYAYSPACKAYKVIEDYADYAVLLHN